MTQEESKGKEKKKGFFGRLIEKLDKKMKVEAEKKTCCGGDDEKKGSSCC